MITSPIPEDNVPQNFDATSDGTPLEAPAVVDEVVYVDVPEDGTAGDETAFAEQEVGVVVAVQESESDELDEESLAVTAPFVGQWNTLISQTNWEKGRIIAEWREALMESGSHVSVYSDETWSRQVGGVTSQHVGRLRRVHERFGETQRSYEGLYWSHFLAAMDWDDAELWLEGAVRSGWSVSQMRKTRWESSGGDPKHAPKDEELITSEIEGEYDQLVEDPEVESDREEKDRIGTTGPLAEGPDFGDSDEAGDGNEPEMASQNADTAWEDSEAVGDMSNPFAKLPELPPDVADALEQFKLCIVRHRSSLWADMSQKTMLDVVDALQQFAMR